MAWVNPKRTGESNDIFTEPKVMFAEFIPHDHARFLVSKGDYLQNDGKVVYKVVRVFDVANGDEESGVYVVDVSKRQPCPAGINDVIHPLHALGAYLTDVGQKVYTDDRLTTKGYHYRRHFQGDRRIRLGDFVEHFHGYSKVVGVEFHTIYLSNRRYNDLPKKRSKTFRVHQAIGETGLMAKPHPEDKPIEILLEQETGFEG